MDNVFFEILPGSLAAALKDAAERKPEELRLRVGQLPQIVISGRELPLAGQAPIREELLQQILRCASGGSLHNVQEVLREGFLTLKGGHRLGICGEAILRDGRIHSFAHISSLNLRIARACRSTGLLPEDSLLIAGPPGCGKTTLLRDTVRRISQTGQRIGLLDQRGEIAASTGGMPQFDVGEHTDVLSGCGKSEGITILLRTMSPRWICLDEITKPEDVQALEQASYCGARLVATAHLERREDLFRRPVYRALLDTGVFPSVALMEPDHSYRLLPTDALCS